MKPNFTLSLSFEGIRLLHRAAGGWRIVGDVAVDSDDLAGELSVLRKTAASLEPGGVRTKLLIPNDQIKYLTLHTPGQSHADRREHARTALEGATPYAVDDLSFDISGDGDQTHVAAVAQETLAEAEAFATEHRFHPVSFVAQPEADAFEGEPFFGLTDIAASLLDPGETVERDTTAIVVLSGLSATDVAAQAAPTSEPAPEPEDVAEAVTGKADIEADAPNDRFDETAPKPTANAEDAASVEEPASAADVQHKTAPAARDTAPALPVAPAPLPKAPTTLPKAPMSAPTPTEGPAATKNPAPSAKAAPAAFASRRSTHPTTPPAAPLVGGASRSPTTKSTATAASTAMTPDSSSLSPSPVATDKPALLGFLSRRKPRAQDKQNVAAANTAQAGAGVARSPSEAEQMTIFGARKNVTVGGKPRYLGLLLTAALLIFLAGVAAWASVFLDDGLSLSRLFGTRETTEIASTPETPVEASVETPIETAAPTPLQAATAENPTEVAEIENDAVVASLDPTLSDEDGAVLDALRVPEQPQPRSFTEQELEAKYATSGIWAMAPDAPGAPGMMSLDDLYMTSIDPVSTTTDAVALPELASFGDDRFNMQFASPAPAGTLFTLDDRGLVGPSEDGTMNPDGVVVYSGRPAVIPPADVDRAAIARTAVAPTEAADPLLDFRPKLRPDGLVENNERSELGGLTRSELANLRPALRPQSIQEAAAAPPAPDVSAAAAAAGASLAAVQTLQTPAAPEPVINNATPNAVKASIRPDTRPGNFARIVKRAENVAPAPTQAASVAPRTVKPSIPSSASVAKQATVRNAMKLRDINLIGVYGKPSNRRALIRLSNGRYQKVAVGDRLNGGRVSAIGDSELRYQRRGRDVVLRIPSG